MSDNFFYDPINPAANVTIYVGGLSISNYNSREKAWETIFPRHVHDHYLKLNVIKFVSGHQVEETICDDIRPNEVFTVTTSSAETVEQHFRTPGFNYQSYSDKRNLGWCIDFATERMHGDRKIKFKKEKPVTCLTIKDSTFYTARHAEGKYKIKNQDWNVGHWLGADIEATGTLNIDFKVEPGKSLQLPLEEKVKYVVTFDNSCAEDDRQCLATNDFRFYYDLVNENPIDVIPPPRLTGLSGKDPKKLTRTIFRGTRGKRVACEIAICSQMELNSLFKLA